MDQNSQTPKASPRDVAATIAPYVGHPRAVPERPANLTVHALPVAAAVPASTVTDEVDDLLEALGPAAPGEPEPGVAVQVQQLTGASQRRLFAAALTRDGAYFLTPAGTTRDAACVIRFRWHPELKVVFRASAVASVDDRGAWAIDSELLP